MSKKCPYAKTVLVTGASSGIGMETADLFAMNGFQVYAASRHPRKTDNPNIHPIEMDVTDEKSIEKAAEGITELGMIIHCAGFGISGSAEMTPLDRARAQMETNYFGVLNVNRVFLPLLRKNSRSLVLITGSVAGFIAIPYQSHYSSSKYALEAYSRALRIEAGQFGVKVTIVQPGDTKTGFTKARTSDEPDNSPYIKQCQDSVAHMAHDEQTGRSANSVANVFLKLAYRKNPPVNVAVGFEYKTIAFLSRILPSRLITWLVKLIYIS
jgi:short-subunit dehydrogenase